MSMCVDEIAAAATADAMGVVYECADLDHEHPLAMRLITRIYMEISCVVDEYRQELQGGGDE